MVAVLVVCLWEDGRGPWWTVMNETTFETSNPVDLHPVRLATSEAYRRATPRERGVVKALTLRNSCCRPQPPASRRLAVLSAASTTPVRPRPLSRCPGIEQHLSGSGSMMRVMHVAKQLTSVDNPTRLWLACSIR
ncbi:hypothetical protein GCM10009541_61170 [Micromonospora gifhornensis]|uniref:Uncharacterized protein n=1 Tax=Micromonospora gifhornensis TaxID=84594 RepID=A0ABQ4IL84_9ACTN|nr:hypothetical protein Vgi01_53540 [Micromonospora gifhornensis]